MPTTSQRTLAARVLSDRKAIRAMELAAGGMTADAIAHSLLPCDDHRPQGRQDCAACLPMYADRSGAKRAIDRMLAREYALGAASREQLRQHHLAQIDLLLRAKMPDALNNGSPSSNEAARVVLRALDRRARLLGLDAPARVTVTTELDAQIEELVAQLAGVDQ